MKAAKIFITLDNTHHHSRRAAEEWCEDRYRERISEVAYKIVKTDFKYTSVVDLLLDSETQKLLQDAFTWKEDAFLEGTDDE